MYKPSPHLLIFVACLLALAGCGSDKPPLSPAAALKTFHLPPGFRIELAASEPDVVDPVAMAFDAHGRMFVVEMTDYPMDPVPRGKIKMLEDTDGDGRFETSRVFADGLSMPNGVMAWGKGILVTAAPDVLYFEDTDGDGRADIRRVVLTGFAKTNPQLRVNGLLYGIDNWIYLAYPRVPRPVRYTAEFGDPGSPIRFPDHPEVPAVEAHSHDIRFRMDPPAVEATAGDSQFGNTFDAWGNRFTVWNNDHVRHVVIGGRYLARNPFLVNPAEMQSASDHENAAKLYQIAKDPKYIHDSQVGHFTSACGISVYTGGRFPVAYQRSSFTCDPVHNVVHRDVLADSGATYRASSGHAGGEFLASTDGWFRPVFTTTGPDGALYVVDYYHEVIEHPEFVPQEMLNEIEFETAEQRGRIYRIVAEESGAGERIDLGTMDAAALAGELKSPNMWRRITAQRLLVERREDGVIPTLGELSKSAPTAESRLQALYTLDGMGALSSELAAAALEDPEARVRENAVKLAERFLGEPAIQRRVLEMAADADAKVQFQVACTLGNLPPKESFPLVREIAMRHLDDTWFQTAALSASPEHAIEWFRLLSRDNGFLKEEKKARSEFLEAIAGVIGARGIDRDIAEVLARTTAGPAERPAWWQLANLRGVASGISQASARRLPAAQQRVVAMLLDAPSEEFRNAAIAIAENLEWVDGPQVRGLFARARRLAADERTDVAVRAQAIRVLGLEPGGPPVEALAALIKPQQPELIQTAAIDALSRSKDAQVGTILLKDWTGLTGPVKEAALRAMVTDAERATELLAAVEGGKLERWSVSSTRQRQLMRHSDEAIAARAKKLFGDSFAGARRDVYEQYRPALRRTGDVARGKQVFRRVCADCHKIGDTGNAVGPDLLSVVIRNKEVLMTDILLPNESIEAGYEEYLVDTKDGRSVSGVIAAESASAVTLRRAKGEEDTIARDNIAELRSLNVSAMPEDLEKQIGVEEMADLLAYLKSL